MTDERPEPQIESETSHRYGDPQAPGVPTGTGSGPDAAAAGPAGEEGDEDGGTSAGDPLKGVGAEDVDATTVHGRDTQER